ncbi:hypothetical protein N0M98_09520 [Paenibacillus doosanensis]|uniref:hypothetical protein n=1 Tax=Paenibacillus doosanensis TaxID=1229154 RepID=UPI00218008A6|nr:hypothetical protein [Paenibacillus doosanensis]MCS7460380.1 hypothetical protein [Paenibacillus doosanensis]
MPGTNDLDLNKLDELANQTVIPENQPINKKTRRSTLDKYKSNDQPDSKRERKVKPVSFAISYELDGQIDRYCQRHYMKKSTFATLALEQYLSKKLSEESEGDY